MRIEKSIHFVSIFNGYCVLLKAELAVHKKKTEDVESWIRLHTATPKVLVFLFFIAFIISYIH